MKKLLILFFLLAVFADRAHAHEIVGEVTPFMVHMKRALLLIESGKGKEAAEEIERVYGDFSMTMQMDIQIDIQMDLEMDRRIEGAGLKALAQETDQEFGSQLEEAFDRVLKEEDTALLEKTIQRLVYYRMMKKFTALESYFERPDFDLKTHGRLFLLGRNYYSYLLEPILAARDPVEEKRLSRLLDRMFYRLEDRRFRQFSALRQEFSHALIEAFQLMRKD